MGQFFQEFRCVNCGLVVLEQVGRMGGGRSFKWRCDLSAGSLAGVEEGEGGRVTVVVLMMARDEWLMLL